MASSPPRLEVVGAEPEAPPGEPAPGAEELAAGAPGREPDRRRRLALVVVTGLLLLAVVAVGVQLQRNVELAGQVGDLREELATTRAALSAHRSQLDRVRASVSELHELVKRDPLQPLPDR